MKGKGTVFILILSFLAVAGGIVSMAGSIDLSAGREGFSGLIREHRSAYYKEPVSEEVLVAQAPEDGGENAAGKEDSLNSGNLPEDDAAKKEDAGSDVKTDEAGKEEGLKNVEDPTKLRDAYDRIVVLDPGHGGGDRGISVTLPDKPDEIINEKDVALDIALKTKALLEDEGIYVVMTRSEDVRLSNEERADIANMIPADMFVGFHMTQDEDSEKYGIGAYYNDEFYAETILGAELAYVILESATEVSGEKATGIYSINENTSAVRYLMIPGVEISVAQMSNVQDVKLVSREDYRQKIARGVADGIEKAFEQIDPEK